MEIRDNMVKGYAWAITQNSLVLRGLRDGRSFQEIMNSLKFIEWAFRYRLDTIACCDDRVILPAGRKIGLAGQLILIEGEDEYETFIKSYRGEIPYVVSHSHCGAAANKFETLNKHHPYATSDDFGIYFSALLAHYIEADYSHLMIDNGLHTARGICLDGTGWFNSHPSVLPELPPHFLCSAPGFGLSDEYCKQELKLLTDIALSDHGFGEFFTNESPFYIFMIARDPDQVDYLLDIADSAIGEFKQVEVVAFNLEGIHD
ncbi:hypothetical protein K8R32_02695 [bacterium]|nr:hypothetical protein [bacterium]